MQKEGKTLNMKISVLTSTYNRANLLDKLYTSLLINSNSCREVSIEWLIMDDGSTDNTREVVDGYIKENILEVKYYFQENQGKMTAINNLIRKCTGDIIIECDSDDYFTKGAFKAIEESIKQCKDIGNIYALVFLKYDQNGKNMGNEFKENNHTSKMFDLYFKEGITGEKALVYNAKIRKQFKYEVENNEKFVTEARMHHKMDLQYEVRCFNIPIMICEYKKDGYTKNINKQFSQSPYGYYEYFREIFNQNMKNVKLNKRMYAYKHYVLFSVLTKQKNPIKKINGLFNKLMIAILYLPGKIVTNRRIKKNN